MVVTAHVVVVAVCLLALSAPVFCDVYMQNPRGSNNRLNEANRNRNNANRLFDSQNNCRGGVNVGTLKYYVGSELPVEWTAQHGCNNPNLKCDIILQYMCESPSSLLGGVRDGTTTDTIPQNQNQCRDGNCDVDYRFGRHESYKSYQYCQNRERNKGLFQASQQIAANRNSAIYTRQNPTGNRYGYECTEERDYYPYWHPSEWKDIAIITDSQERCSYYQANSQNVVDKGTCVNNITGAYLSHNNPTACRAARISLNGKPWASGKWAPSGKWNLPPPVCQTPERSRDNHLGNVIGGYTAHFNWTIPNDVNSRCTLRIRYNITTGDFDGWNTFSDKNDPTGRKVGIKGTFPTSFNSTSSPSNYPLANNPIVDFGVGIKLQLAVNTQQFFRTFQDRSHVFEIASRPSCVNPLAKIKNLNIRGKRGNIVQTYPSTEYDFTPDRLEIDSNTLVHVQWSGSNTNPNNNDGQGKEGTDRHNLIQLMDNDLSRSYPMSVASSSLVSDPFFAYLMSLTEPGHLGGNTRELDDAGTYFNAGLVPAPLPGRHNYMCTRNNNFSNRGQKALINVTPVPFNVALITPSQGGQMFLRPNKVSTATSAPLSTHVFVDFPPGVVSANVPVRLGVVQDHKSLSEAKAVSGLPFFSDWNSAIISIFPDEGSSYDSSVNLAESYSVNLMYTRPASTPADQLIAVRSKCATCQWEIVPWAHFGEQVDWIPDNMMCVPPSMAHSNVTVHLHSISFGYYAVVTLNKDLSVGRVVAPVTNVSSLMMKDQVSGAMKPIDPKSSLASQLSSITMTRAEMPSDVVRLMDLQNSNVESPSSSSFNTGAAVGVPVALFFVSLLLCLFYRRNPFLYTRHRDAFFHACRWILALCTCKLGAIHQQSSIVRPKSRTSFTRLENDLPHSDSDSSDAEVLHPAPVSSVSAPALASSPSRSSSAPDADATQHRPKPKSNVPEIPRASRHVLPAAHATLSVVDRTPPNLRQNQPRKDDA